MSTSENLRRAQLLADTAFDMLMWNPNGDGTTYTERPISDRQRDSIESMTALSQAYSTLVATDVADVADVADAATASVAGDGMDPYVDPVSGWVQDGATGR